VVNNPDGMRPRRQWRREWRVLPAVSGSRDSRKAVANLNREIADLKQEFADFGGQFE